MSSRLQIYSAYQQRLQTQDYAYLGEFVDLQGYTENCLGLTGWTTAFEGPGKLRQEHPQRVQRLRVCHHRHHRRQRWSGNSYTR